MNTLDFLVNKFNLDLSIRPTPIPLGRNELGGLLKELGFKVGVEIGVDQGFHAETFCQPNPDLKLYCIDPWTTYKSDVYDPFSVDQELQNRNYENTISRLVKYKCAIIKDFSMNAIKNFAPNSIDFVYIDGNHDYDHVLEDISAWTEIVRPDGIVAGHDYGRNKKYRHVGQAVTQAINDYVSTHEIKNFFILPRNYCSDWFFIK